MPATETMIDYFSVKIKNSNHHINNNNNAPHNLGLMLTATYLHNSIDMKTHDKFWDIAHQIVKPVVNSCQNVDWFIVVPEKHGKKVRSRK